MAEPAEPLRRYLQAQRALDREVVALLRQVARDTVAQINKLERTKGVAATVRKAQLRLVLRTVLQIQQDFWVAVGDAVQAARLEAANKAVDLSMSQDAKVVGTLLNRADLRAWAEVAARAAAQRGIARSLGVARHDLSTRVYRNAQLASGRIDKLVNSALARGLSARELAKEVRAFILPSTPGGVSFAAMRLARTELNNSFHAASIATYDRPWVEKVEWHLSGSHPRPDECNVLASKKYEPDAVPNKPHPQCLCFTTVETVSPAEFRRALVGGQYDDWLEQNNIGQ